MIILEVLPESDKPAHFVKPYFERTVPVKLASMACCQAEYQRRGNLGCPWGTPDAQDANPEWFWSFDRRGMDDGVERSGAGAWVGAELIRPGKPRIPDDSDQTLGGPLWACFFCHVARATSVLVSRAARTWSRRPGHVHRERDPGGRRTHVGRSSGDPTQPPTCARPGTRRPGTALGPTGGSSGR
jgi:hypothetical protein